MEPHYIRSVQITMAENFGVRGRGAFYEEAGAIRDVIQNHLLQVLAPAMDPPRTQATTPFATKSRGYCKAMRPLAPERRARPVPGLSAEKGVGARLAGRDLRGGAAVRRQLALGRRAVLHPRRQVPAGDPHRGGGGIPAPAARSVRKWSPSLSSHLRLRLNREVLIALGMRVKVPASTWQAKTSNLIVTRQPGDMAPYERLLGDALRGDLFCSPARTRSKRNGGGRSDPGRRPGHEYAPNTWGPSEADELTADHGGWIDPK